MTEHYDVKVPLAWQLKKCPIGNRVGDYFTVRNKTRRHAHGSFLRTGEGYPGS
jgi:hypothetical protein